MARCSARDRTNFYYFPYLEILEHWCEYIRYLYMYNKKKKKHNYTIAYNISSYHFYFCPDPNFLFYLHVADRWKFSSWKAVCWLKGTGLAAAVLPSTLTSDSSHSLVFRFCGIYFLRYHCAVGETIVRCSPASEWPNDDNVCAASPTDDNRSIPRRFDYVKRNCRWIYRSLATD